MAEILPPDEERARVYQSKNFTEIKVLCADGSVIDALPVDINMPVEGIATSANQTNGTQKTQVVDSLGSEVLFEDLLNSLLKPTDTLSKVGSIESPVVGIITTAANALGSWDYSIPFNTGLILVTVGNGLDATIVYE